MIAWALDALIGVTLAMLIVLAVRRPVARYFGAGWAYALWLMPLFRLFMPDLDLLGGAAAAALPQTTLIVIPAAAPALASTAPAAAGGSADFLLVLLALWGGGAAVFAMWQQSAYSAFLLSLGTHCRPGRPPSHGGIPVVESGAVDGPLAVGLVGRRIVVPLDFESRYSPSERRLALEHELVHHRRGDIFWNYAALAMLALTWFSPISWLAFRAFRTDQELACDAAVAAHAPADARLDYAFALVKSASRPGEIAACPLNRADQLKRRLRMIALHRRSPLRSLGGALALALLLAFGLALSSPGFAQEEVSAPPQAEIVVSDGAGAAAVVDRSDAAALMVRCGSSIPETTPRYRSFPEQNSRVIMCDREDVARDPAVQALVARAIGPTRRDSAAVRPAALAETKAALSEAAAAPAVLPVLAAAFEWHDPGDAAEVRREAIELAEDARREALAAAAEARREAALEAEEARREARADAAEARREAAHARAESAEARREALREAAHARDEAAHARDEAAHARAEAAQARAEAAHARREALRAAAEARREAQRARRIHRIVMIQPAQARAFAFAQAHVGGPVARIRLRLVPAVPPRAPAAPAPPAAPALPAGFSAEVAREMRDLGRELERELAPLSGLAAIG